MTPVPQNRSRELIDELNEALDHERPLSEFEIRRYIQEASSLIDADPAEAFTLLGILAGIEQNEEQMHHYHGLAIKHSVEDPYHVFNYAVSIGRLGRLEESLSWARKAYERAVDRTVKMSALDFMIQACLLLGKDEQFIDYAYEWELIEGEPHKLMSEEEGDAQEVEINELLTAFDKKIETDRKSFVRLNLNELGAADESLNDARE